MCVCVLQFDWLHSHLNWHNRSWNWPRSVTINISYYNCVQHILHHIVRVCAKMIFFFFSVPRFQRIISNSQNIGLGIFDVHERISRVIVNAIVNIHKSKMNNCNEYFNMNYLCVAGEKEKKWEKKKKQKKIVECYSNNNKMMTKNIKKVEQMNSYWIRQRWLL